MNKESILGFLEATKDIDATCTICNVTTKALQSARRADPIFDDCIEAILNPQPVKAAPVKAQPKLAPVKAKRKPAKKKATAKKKAAKASK